MGSKPKRAQIPHTREQTCAEFYLVDDEEEIRLLLSGILGLRYRVMTAVDGVDALEQIAGGEGDFDLVMPRLDGSGLTERILADYPDLGAHHDERPWHGHGGGQRPQEWGVRLRYQAAAP